MVQSFSDFAQSYSVIKLQHRVSALHQKPGTEQAHAWSSSFWEAEAGESFELKSSKPPQTI